MPINRKLGVNLEFTADTNKAKTQLQKLQETLNSLVKNTAKESPLGLTKEINQAVSDVNKLGIALKNATSKTGKLDLSQFKQQLDKAGLSAEKIANQLMSLGPVGKQAFAELSQSIVTAEIPLKRSSTLLTEFATTLKNTARWQISSSILHGFMGSIQSAYYYAQDLNESLNNIRIVTGKSTEEMAQFAKEANDAAKALSTTTTAYTDASLIYYQQGLDDEQVKERTDVTIKMANVARESATTVSEQLTAVWNNFAKGGENLEYYADVMTALGAATASSSAEIAEGLEKFAAAADTVGLSYEYATAALATVTATTRQSADIVGNAFKTLFSRMQGLKLGETLDDGTDLNKYSAALDAVGISIKKTDGELKDMDTILDELGERWQDLTKDQKMALAQTVAGVRQYTQLIALMDNWDFFQSNLSVAQEAEGTLQNQADIYAESWEAASKRTQAAMESIYQSILDDKFFINLTDSFGKFFNLINNSIKALGGLKGTLSLIGSILLKVYNNDLVSAIDRVTYNIKTSLGITREEAIKTREDFIKQFDQFQDDGTRVGAAQTEIYKEQGALQELLITKSKELLKENISISEEEQNQVNTLLKLNNVLGENYIQSLKECDVLEQQIKQQEQIVLTKAKMANSVLKSEGLKGEDLSGFNKEIETVSQLQQHFETLGHLAYNYYNSINKLGDASATEGLSNIVKILDDIGVLLPINNNLVKDLKSELENLKDVPTGQLDTAFQKISDDLDELASVGFDKIQKLKDKFADFEGGSKQSEKAIDDFRSSIDVLIDKISKFGITAGNAGKGLESFKNQSQSVAQAIEDLGQRSISTSQQIVTVARSIATLSMSINQIKGLVNTWNDEDLSFGEKLLSSFTSLGFVIPNLISSFGQLNNLISSSSLVATTEALNIALAKKVALSEASAAWDAYSAAAAMGRADAENLLDIAIEKNVAVQRLEIASEKTNILTKIKAKIATLLHTTVTNADTTATNVNTTALIANKIALLGIVAAAGIAIFAIYKIADAMIYTADEANEATKEIKDNITSVESELSSLQDKLNDINSKIDELLKKDHLTLTDKEDLARLQAESAELKAQIALQEEKAKNLHRDQVENAVKAAKAKSYGSASTYENVANKYIDNEEIQAYINKYLEDKNYNQEELFNSAKLMSDFIHNLAEYEKENTNYNSQIPMPAISLDMQKFISDLRATKNQTSSIDEEDFESILINAQEIAKYGSEVEKQEALPYYQEKLEAYYKQKGSWDTLLQETVNSTKDLDEQDTIRVIKTFAEEWGVSVDSIVEDIKLYGIKVEEVKEETENIVEIAKENLEELNSVVDTLHQGKDISEEQSNYLSSLENKYIDLGEAMRVFGRNAKEYITILEQVQEAEEKLTQEQLKETLSEGKSSLNNARTKLSDAHSRDAKREALGGHDRTEVDVIANMDAVTKAIDDVFNTKYELEVSLTGDILTDVDAIVDKAENAAMAVEKIGKNFEVAAEDVETLFNVFPELAENARVLADGTLKLDEQITSQILSNYGTIIDADKKKTAQEINNRIEELEAEKAKVQAALEQVQQKNVTEQDLIKITEQYALQSNEDIATSDKNTTDAAIQNSGVLAETIIKNWQAAATAAKEYGIIAMAAAAGEDTSGMSVAGGSVTFTGATKDAAVPSGNKTKQQAFEEQRKVVEEGLKKQVESYERQIADLTRGASKLLASTDNIEKSAIKGLEDKDKSKKSGGKDKQDKELKKLEDEFDRYWEIKKAIDAVDRAISRLDKDQENLYGYELINSLKQENQLLEKQKENYEALAAAQREEAAELQGVLSGYGMTFDASGAITNYAAATSAALAEYNAAIAQYNAGLIDESTLKVYEKNYEAFKKALDRYETLYYQEMQDTQDKLDEIWRKELANNLKAWNVEVKLKLDMKELKRGWNDFITEIQKDFQKVFQDLRVDVKNLAEDAKTYLGDEGTISTITKAVRDVTNEIDILRGGGQSSMFESISQAQEKLKELNSTLQDSARAMHKLWEDAWQNYLDGIDQVSDQFDNLIDRFEKINDELEFQKEIIELLYGPEAYALMGKYYEGQEKNSLEQMKSLKTQKDMWEDLWRASGATMENQASWTEDQQKYYEEWQQAQSDLNDLVLEYIRLLKDEYMNTVNDILKQLERGITGSSLSDLETEWERISAHAEKYYDDVEGAYEIQKLANEIDESIAAADNLKAQQKLQALREKEISYLREKDNLTKYDLDAAEARYQIALKEIALEEARNNKTSMKLTRNEQGNWSYQYIADEEDVMSKRQELLDAYAQLYQLASDAYEENLKALQDLQQKYLDSAREIYEDETLSEEERQQRLLDLREWYLNEYALLADENTLYRNDLELGASALLLEIYNQDQEAYTAMTDAERALLDELIAAHIDGFMDLEEKLKDNYQEIGDKAKEVMTETREDWSSGAQQLADLWNGDHGASVKVQVITAYERIMDASQRYQEKVDQCAAIVERDFGEEGITGAIERAEQETDNLKYKTEDLVASSIPYLNELKYYVDMIADAWRSVQQEILDAIGLIEEYLQYVGEANRAAQEQAMSAAGAAAQAAATTGGGSGGNRGGGNSQPTIAGYYYTDPYGASGTVALTDIKGNIQRIDSENNLKGNYINVNTGELHHFATGGYTGEWNSGSTDGRLAVLHQKELVLNESDTKNFLAGISTLRDMSAVNGSISDSIARAIANTIVELGQRKGNIVTTTNSNSSSNTENHFNITAEFPNATNVDDIREAILSLPNIASQYIANNNK